MKKRLLFFALVLLMLLHMPLALADEALDLTADCTVKTSGGKYKLNRLYDRDWGTTFICQKVRHPYIEVTAPRDQPVYGVYVCFGDKVIPWQVQVQQNGKWNTVYTDDGAFAHQYVALEGVSAFRLAPVTDKQTEFTLSELFVFGEGETPSFVQQWQPAPEKADLLVLSAHPDDEVLFFGGAIPYYAGELHKNVVVAYLTCGTMERRSELLNGLWEMGVRTYPVIGDFWDKYSKKLDTAYDVWGKNKINHFIITLLRQYKPDVVVTHDVKGEYGHGAHLVCADAMQNCIALAANDAKDQDSLSLGVWQVKKLYLHLYPENTLEMDWDQPLSAFDGKTGFEKAVDAYQWHVSQHEAGQKNKQTGKFEVFVVEPRDSDYSCYRFGLAFSAVGEDVQKNDFFENIP